MQLYTEEDVLLSKEKLPDIIDKIEDIKGVTVEPSYDSIMKVNKIVMDFIKENKRKIYGGFAQNKLVSAKDPKDAFYKETAIPDIDFYSPDPISDLKVICNRLYDAGFPFVQGAEAAHEETYKVFANFEDVCDISYVPRNVYHKIPFVEIDGIYYVSPSFTTIDIYRMLTEPFFSSRRWEKTFPRLQLLQKHYPLNRATSSLNDPDIKLIKDNQLVNSLLGTVYEFIKNRKSVIVYGRYAYNCYLEESNIINSTNLGKKYKLLDIPYYEFTSTNYREDVGSLIKMLKDKHKNVDKLVVDEHYPFWQLLGYSSYIRLGDVTIAHIVHYNKRCTPIHKVDAKIYKNGTSKKDSGTIQIGSYTYCLLMSMVTAFRMKVIDDKERYTFYNIMASHYAEIRKYYLKKNNKTIFDKTLFQEFIPECIGDTIDPMRESRLVRRQKYLAGKYPYKYDPKPKEERSEDTSSTYRFANSSGNSINKEKNFKVRGNIPRRGMEESATSPDVEEPDEVIEKLDIKDVEEKAKGSKKKLK